ncbi:MAG: glycosyltransferase family 4 protein [Capsulimonadales bacterium]|nr:glycosyltransferase family 4 protein [Capsulimonadales bacterium]
MTSTPTTEDSPRRTFLFLSSCPEPWGGSEELWGQTALRLVGQGHRVHAVKTNVETEHRRIRQMTDAGITFEDHWNLPMAVGLKVARRLLPRRWNRRFDNRAYQHLCDTMRQLQPDLVVISQGENFDGLEFSGACSQMNMPYVVISQKASDWNWPVDEIRRYVRRTYFEARASYFVSRHNRELTEEQIGVRLSNAEVVRNPFLTPVEEPLPWPESPDGRFRLACVARLFVLEKGQDILLQALAQDRWKERPLEVTFFGKGMQSEALSRMAELLGVTNVRFAGFTWDVPEIWRTHHALVLSSRCEGLPLSLVEAMWCGRPAIVTTVGGNAEIIDDGVNGFLAAGLSPSSFDAALERAWERRHDWERIGRLAAQRVRERITDDPVETFAEKLLHLCQ